MDELLLRFLDEFVKQKKAKRTFVWLDETSVNLWAARAQVW